ncbi:MAG: sugar phosphate isomerase/epimerase family protein [Saprospiraceae bacterium]
MTRRQFLIQSSAMASAAAIYPACQLASDPASTFALGYQLYSIRDLMTLDPLDTLTKLKAMGYQHGEVYGFDASTNLIFGVSPSELQSMFADLDMQATSGHYDFSTLLEASDDDMRAYTDKCIACAKTLNSKYIVWPFLREHQRTLEAYGLLVDKLNVIGEHIKGSGIGLAYHNHGYEFQDHGGTSGYQMLISETDAAHVKLQLDMYWLAYDPKKTPTQLIAEQPGRYVMWHIKDMHKVSRDYTELGNGSIDYTTYLPSPKTSGLEYFYVEQGGNYTVDSLTSASASAAYFQKNLRSKV